MYAVQEMQLVHEAGVALEAAVATMQTRLHKAVDAHLEGAQHVLAALRDMRGRTHCAFAALNKQWDECAEEARVTHCGLRAYAAMCARDCAGPANIQEAEMLLAMSPRVLTMREMVPSSKRVAAAFRKFGWLVRAPPSASHTRAYVPVAFADATMVAYLDVRDDQNVSMVSRVKAQLLLTVGGAWTPISSTCSTIIRANLEMGVLNLRTAYGRLLRVCCVSAEPVTFWAYGVPLCTLFAKRHHALRRLFSCHSFALMQRGVQPHLTSISPCKGQWFVHAEPMSPHSPTFAVSVRTRRLDAHLNDYDMVLTCVFRYDGPIFNVLATCKDTFLLANGTYIDEFSVQGNYLRRFRLPTVTAHNEVQTRVLLAMHRNTVAVMQCVRTAAGRYAPRRLELFQLDGPRTDNSFIYNDMENDVNFSSMCFACNGRALVLFPNESYALLLSRLWRSWSWIPLGDDDKVITGQCVIGADEIVRFGIGDGVYGRSIVTISGDCVLEDWSQNGSEFVHCLRHSDRSGALYVLSGNRIIELSA